jgi:ppGpp synthetase/RelA/SpoT-type nucleotidyltranferase
MKRTSTKWSGAVAEQYQHEYRHKCGSAAEHVRKTLENVLRKQEIKCATVARGKDEESLEKKLFKQFGEQERGIEELVPHLGTECDDHRIKDLAGARVSLYFPSDWARVEKEIFAHFTNVTFKEHPEARDNRPSRRRFHGYVARHYYVDEPEYKLRVEVQVASVLTHAWSEVDHDLFYKEREEPLDAGELAILDSVNGITTAGDCLLDELKLRLLNRGIIKSLEGESRQVVAVAAVKQSICEFAAIGQNLYDLLVGEGKESFCDALIQRLETQTALQATLIVADSSNEEQMRELGYGFPSFRDDLRKATTALKSLQTSACEAGVGPRLTIGNSKCVKTKSILMSDPEHDNGVAYVRYAQLGSSAQDRPIVTIEKRRHASLFGRLKEEFGGYRAEMVPL